MSYYIHRIHVELVTNKTAIHRPWSAPQWPVSLLLEASGRIKRKKDWDRSANIVCDSNNRDRDPSSKDDQQNLMLCLQLVTNVLSCGDVNYSFWLPWKIILKNCNPVWGYFVARIALPLPHPCPTLQGKVRVNFSFLASLSLVSTTTEVGHLLQNHL